MTERNHDAREQGAGATAPRDHTAPGRLSRRAFVARAAALGLSGAAVSAFLAACGGSATATTAAGGAATTAPTTAAGGAATTAPTTAATTAATKAATPATGGAASPVSSPTSAAAASPTSAAAASPAGSPSATKYDINVAPAVTNADAAKKYSGQKITYYGDAVHPGDQLDKVVADAFTKATGIQVNVVPKPQSSTENYATYQRFFQAQSPDLDVMMLDVIWPSSFAPHLIDVSSKLGDLAKGIYPSAVQNDTVDGKLIALPWFGDFGILYYRTDLMQKYGLSSPPATWDELETMAKKIADGEKAGNSSFSGFVFQGNAYEGLTCDALEWSASTGGGTWVDQNKKVTIDNDQFAAILKKAQGWIGTIAPKGVTTYQEADTANAFVAGNAAFARNWPYMYALAQDPKAPVNGKFDVAALPASSGQKHVGTLGGWQLGVSKYSKAQDAAIEFVRYIGGPDVVKWRAIVGTYVPLYTAVAEDPDVIKNQPYLKNLADVERVVRPSNALGANYNEGSTAIFQGINQVLTGADPKSQLSQISQRLQRLLS
ncbi:MAG TPA: ABC transporter substrate-binding protein [Thermomicrobiales bacterium]|nr:ABC transporter substrate-binding protein [Thermomicrobiales bacterium]